VLPLFVFNVTRGSLEDARLLRCCDVARSWFRYVLILSGMCLRSSYTFVCYVRHGDGGGHVLHVLRLINLFLLVD